MDADAHAEGREEAERRPGLLQAEVRGEADQAGRAEEEEEVREEAVQAGRAEADEVEEGRPDSLLICFSPARAFTKHNTEPLLQFATAMPFASIEVRPFHLSAEEIGRAHV